MTDHYVLTLEVKQLDELSMTWYCNGKPYTDQVNLNPKDQLDVEFIPSNKGKILEHMKLEGCTINIKGQTLSLSPPASDFSSFNLRIEMSGYDDKKRYLVNSFHVLNQDVLKNRAFVKYEISIETVWSVPDTKQSLPKSENWQSHPKKIWITYKADDPVMIVRGGNGLQYSILQRAGITPRAESQSCN